jgi:hypothetical protein
MSKVFVVVAHQDDWQLFMGSDVFQYVRNGTPVTIVVTTAGNGPHPEYHWKSRLSGAVLSVLRALPSFSPYRLQSGEAPDLPAGFTVRYERAEFNGKTVLSVCIQGESTAPIMLYFMHLPDGGTSGSGFAPGFGSLTKLREGTSVSTLWPEETPCLYESWNSFVSTLEAIIRADHAGGDALVLAADVDLRSNPGDHVDHGLTSKAVGEVVARNGFLRPVWFSMYANAERPENLDGKRAGDQRAAIYAYGGGYTACAAGFGETWRTGWEREYSAYKNRRYTGSEPE